ncbi:YIEGIA family protein [Paenactinomyces guangxiensis]|uniref:YIEGIA domain-containing protein n=1 Tax=Paenactinomyces guangxiensis TaxID=1490290 RepID=A0A7W2A9D6_9BACL|nr:YIEGIA family protein [Paenactinomyces guangxiensis]MBA4495620.1 YIEGIA domain-containing protein [Paenactinomyces guangxiensis]MBH8592608.1 YIEGIA family protein [Paenactinomyces guangxiensis]
MHIYTWAVVVGVIMGILTRMRMLQIDYRQYPTYPHGYITHLALGLIASALGAVAVPALLQKDYTAVTFLALAAQQFRDVRNMERETLSKLDEMELVPRGASYIEGIAKVFESRNYLVMLSAILTSLSVILSRSWLIGIIAGVILIGITGYFMSGKVVKDIAVISEGQLRVEGANLFVEDIYLMNIGLEDNKKRILEHGIGIIIKPKDASSVVTIGNLGQRQAIMHDVSAILGVFRDTGEPALVPIAKRDLDDGRLGLLILPQERDVKRAIHVIQYVPVLESAVRRPGQFSEGNIAKQVR